MDTQREIDDCTTPIYLITLTLAIVLITVTPLSGSTNTNSPPGRNILSKRGDKLMIYEEAKQKDGE